MLNKVFKTNQCKLNFAVAFNCPMEKCKAGCNLPCTDTSRFDDFCKLSIFNSDNYLQHTTKPEDKYEDCRNV